jgi:hypothetical protein
MNFFDADRLASKDLAEVNLFVAHTDAAAAGDDDDLVVKGIVDIGQSGINARRRLIDLSRALHGQSFVRTLVVEDVDEVVEACWLLKEVGSGRLGGFFLEREVHAFMAAILLGMAGLDSFNANAQAKPPDGKLAQMEQSVCGREGNALSLRICLTGEEKTASVIGDGQWVTVVPIAQQELALVIGAPQFIGMLA